MRHVSGMLAALVCTIPAIAGAQQWRTIESARQVSGMEPTTVSIKYAAGKLDVAPLDGGLLYQMRIRFDEQAMDAVHEYDAEEHHLDLGLNSATVGWRALRGMKHHDQGGSMSVGLSRQVPMELEISLGGVEANLELGGLRLTNLNIESGMVGATVRFSEPNRAEMEQLSIDLGLGALKLVNVGRANASEISIDGGLGGVSLDFGDLVLRDVTVHADMSLGQLRIAVPPNVGVMVRGDITAGKFERYIGFTRADDAWYSLNWKEASHRITIVTETTLAKLRIEPTR